MRLARLTLENFRCYVAPISIDFDDLTAIVGRNDVGKSAIMDALAIFFGEAKTDKDDASMGGDRSAMMITCEFEELPSQLILDADYATSLSAEHLLNGDGRLVVRKTYNGALATPKETAVEAIALHPTAEGFDDLLALKKAELVARAADLGVDLQNVNKQANAPIRAAIWAAADNLNLHPRAVGLEAEGSKQVWASLSTYLPTFALFKSDRASTDQDEEAQDPLKAAIKEAIKEVEAQLEQVKQHVENEVRKIADATVNKLREMDPSIAETLNPVITTNKWESLFKTSITGDEGIPLNKRGSGVKRLVLLNFFRAKAERDASEQSSGSVIYGIEEPETSQHPRNQRMLLAALRELAASQGRQVIVTTHTPMLARYLTDSSLRFIEKDDDGVRTITNGGPDTSECIARSLGVLADHNVKLFIGVEGPHDISFLKGIARVLRSAGEDVPDLDSLELSGQIIFFPFGGSNLALWASRLRHLNRPEYHICDRDEAPPAPPKYAEHIDAVNGRPSCRAVATNKREMENYLHHEAICEAYASNGTHINLAGAFADFDDVPSLVAEAVHTVSGGDWGALPLETKQKKIRNAKSQLNGPALDRMTVPRLDSCDLNGDVRSWLQDISTMLHEMEA
jgi:AAA15 family ATPase/GTPase